MIKASQQGSAAAVTLFYSIFNVNIIETRTWVSVTYDGNIIKQAQPNTYTMSCCGWYNAGDVTTAWVVQSTYAMHCHSYKFEYKLCLLGLCAPPDQTIGYDNCIIADVSKGYCDASATGTYSYISTSGSCI